MISPRPTWRPLLWLKAIAAHEDGQEQTPAMSPRAGAAAPVIGRPSHHPGEGEVVESQDPDNGGLHVASPAAGKGDSGVHRGLRGTPVVPERSVA